MTNKRKTTTTLDLLTNLLCLQEEFSKVFKSSLYVKDCFVLSNILLHGKLDGTGKYVLREILSCMHDPFLGKLSQLLKTSLGP